MRRRLSSGRFVLRRCGRRGSSCRRRNGGLARALIGKALVDDDKQVAPVGQPRQTGGQGSAGAGNHLLDDAVGLSGRLPHEVGQRVVPQAERVEARRGGLDIAIGIEEGGKMANFGKAADRPFGDVAFAARATGRRRGGKQDCRLAVRQHQRTGDEGDHAARYARRDA